MENKKRLFAVDIWINDQVIIKKRSAKVTAVDGQNIVVQYDDDGSFDAWNPKAIKVVAV